MHRDHRHSSVAHGKQTFFKAFKRFVLSRRKNLQKKLPTSSRSRKTWKFRSWTLRGMFFKCCLLKRTEKSCLKRFFSELNVLESVFICWENCWRKPRRKRLFQKKFATEWICHHINRVYPENTRFKRGFFVEKRLVNAWKIGKCLPALFGACFKVNNFVKKLTKTSLTV